MKVHFYKYQGTGNDFILIDNRKLIIDKVNQALIKNLCNRRFGIGADGLMLLKANSNFDFEMDYYNSDGSSGSMCGNGGRCISAFAKHLGIISEKGHFLASDGPHDVYIDDQGLVKLKMMSVHKIEENNIYSFLNTGSPHYVQFVKDTKLIDVFNEGKKIRFDEKFQPGGTNVNFVTGTGNRISVRTYERGVEDETYSCGTGSVASAIAYYSKYKISGKVVDVNTLGGELQISFEKKDNNFENVYLKGPAILVFEGDIEIDT